MTRAEDLYNRLRSDILAARLPPGHRLKFPELCRSYETSVGVAREALTRLSGEGLVILDPRRGFSVVTLSEGELVDLTDARSMLEGLALEQAVLYADTTWEASVVSAHHLLSRTKTPEVLQADEMVLWSGVHEGFHTALLNGCPNRRLREVAHSLRDEAELYRRWSRAIVPSHERDLPGEHLALLEAVLARDAVLAVALLREHITLTSRILLGEHEVDVGLNQQSTKAAQAGA